MTGMTAVPGTQQRADLQHCANDKYEDANSKDADTRACRLANPFPQVVSGNAKTLMTVVKTCQKETVPSTPMITMIEN